MVPNDPSMSTLDLCEAVMATVPKGTVVTMTDANGEPWECPPHYLAAGIQDMILDPEGRFTTPWWMRFHRRSLERALALVA